MTPYFTSLPTDPGVYTTLPGCSDSESQYPEAASFLPPNHPSLFLQPTANATYVNTMSHLLHTPVLRIPPPPQIPLPPPPPHSSSGSMTINAQTPVYSTMSREKDFLQQRRMDSSNSYRYSIPVGGTLGRGYPIYSAATMGVNEGGVVSDNQMWLAREPATHFFPGQQQQPVPVETGEISCKSFGFSFHAKLQTRTQHMLNLSYTFK